VPLVEDWNGREIQVATSEGGVLAVADFSDNLIRVDVVPWPPPAVVQKLYESRQSRAFTGDELVAATQTLGVYSDLQSLHSEDAVTWSYFGPLAVEPPDRRARFLNWLLQRLGLDEWAGNESSSIDLWRRVPHPDKSLPGGPELDFVVDGDRCVVFGEVKWRSGEGLRQGVRGDKGQMQLRRDFLAKYGAAIYGKRGFVVLGVTLAGGIEAEPPPDSDGVVTRSLQWSDLGSYPDHPRAEEVGRYLSWKQAHSLR
jgi:hypothetical protein